MSSAQGEEDTDVIQTIRGPSTTKRSNTEPILSTKPKGSMSSRLTRSRTAMSLRDGLSRFRSRTSGQAPESSLGTTREEVQAKIKELEDSMDEYYDDLLDQTISGPGRNTLDECINSSAAQVARGRARLAQLDQAEEKSITKRVKTKVKGWLPRKSPQRQSHQDEE
ncbi:hypothetical protein IAT40_007922 [Kwoniella sp. CBS 6097]